MSKLHRNTFIDVSLTMFLSAFSSTHALPRELEIIVRRIQAKASKIKQLLKLEPKVSLEGGLREVAKDIRAHPNCY